MTALTSATIRINPITATGTSGWAARPFVVVDGVEHECRWSKPLRLPMSAGVHRVAAFIRYKHTSAVLGRGELDVQLNPGQMVRIMAPQRSDEPDAVPPQNRALMRPGNTGRR